MLKPFRIRELLDAAEDARSRQEDGSEGRQHALDGVVRVTSSQYDETVTTNPEARLLYIDDDDGESIMVGSSLELSQRLDEPVPEWLHSAPPQGHASSRESDPAPMHIFDIQRSPHVLSTWRDIHSRSESRPTSSGTVRNIFGQFAPSDGLEDSNTGVTLRDSPSEDVDVQSNDWSDARRRWVQHCDPPQLHTSTPAHQENDAKNEQSATNDAVKNRELVEVGFESKAGCITEEGRRQAKAAGAKLRDSRNLFSDGKSSSSDLPSPTFWNTYSHGEKAFNSEPDQRSMREPKSNESPVEDNSLFNAFEAELAKLMSESAATSEQQPTTDTSPKNNTRQAEPDSAGQDGSRSGVTGPGEIAALTMHTLLSGIAHVTSDLRTRLPEVERRLASLQQNVPSQVESKVNTALQGMKSHVQTLANVMQETARSTRAAAERSRDSEALASAQVDALRNLAHDLGEMGKTLFAAFEARVAAGRGSQGSQSEDDVTRSANEDENSPETQMDGDTDTSPTETTLWILSVSPDATEDMVRDALAAQGFIGKVTLHNLLANEGKIIPRPSHGEIKFPSPYAALGAFQALNNTKICDKPLTLLAPRYPVTKASFLKTTPESGIDTATRDRLRAHFRHRSSFRGCHIPRDTSRSKPNVNFDTPAEADKKATDLRRAKSLSTVRAVRNMLRENESRAPTAPHVPPKEPHADSDGFGLEKETKNVLPETNRTLMDEDSASAEFSARYPPMSTLFGPSTHKANNQRLTFFDNIRRPPQNPTDEVPGAFPSDISSEQRDTAPEPPSYPTASNTLPSDVVGAAHPASLRNPPHQFTSIRRSATERHGTRSEAAYEVGLGSRRHRDHRSVHMANTPGSFPIGNRSNMSILPYPEFRRQPEMTESNLNTGIDLCIGHLQALGFADGDMSRLRIYAEAANGNLGDAIEMIEEERRVLEQHG